MIITAISSYRLAEFYDCLSYTAKPYLTRQLYAKPPASFLKKSLLFVNSGTIYYFFLTLNFLPCLTPEGLEIE